MYHIYEDIPINDSVLNESGFKVLVRAIFIVGSARQYRFFD